MINNKIIKILCSLPVVLLVLYFIPFLGICLILFRCFVYRANKNYRTPILLIVSGLLILVPEVIDFTLKTFKLSAVEIPYLNDILNSDSYVKLLSFSKLLIIIGIVYLIVSYILTMIFNKVGTGVRSLMEQDLQKDYEIRKKNDLIMQEKREKSRNTHAVKCPYCGSDNMLTEQTGICQFCRKAIEYKEGGK